MRDSTSRRSPVNTFSRPNVQALSPTRFRELCEDAGLAVPEPSRPRFRSLADAYRNAPELFDVEALIDQMEDYR